MRLLVLAVSLVLTASLAAAQSLADVARKETERRRTVSGAGKSYTNKDLKPVPQQPPSAESERPSLDAPADDKESPESDKGRAPADGGGKSAKAPDEQAEVRDQEYWSKRQAALQEELERDQTYAAALQSRIDALTMDFVNRDDPAQRDQIAVDRQRAVTELERLRKSIETQRRAIADFEEEARRSGVPPGWLR